MTSAVLVTSLEAVAIALAVLIAAGSVVGGQVGAQVGRRMSPLTLRAVVVGVGLLVSARLLLG